MSDWNQNIIEEFRANDGKVGGIFEGAPLLLVHHVGAKSGTERVTPLMYQSVNGGYAIFASKGGADDNPDWFYNDTIWTNQKRDWPQFAEYEEKTARDVIPVVILEPV